MFKFTVLHVMFYRVQCYLTFSQWQCATCNSACYMQFCMLHAILHATCNTACYMQYCMLHAILHATCNTACYMQYCMLQALLYNGMRSIIASTYHLLNRRHKAVAVIIIIYILLQFTRSFSYGVFSNCTL